MASKTLYLIGIIVLLAIVGILLTMTSQTPQATPTTQPTTTATPTQKVFKLGALLPLTGGFSSYAKLA
jgi:amino acid-binding protein